MYNPNMLRNAFTVVYYRQTTSESIVAGTTFGEEMDTLKASVESILEVSDDERERMLCFLD